MLKTDLDPARQQDTHQLLEDFNLVEDAESFADPHARLEFIGGLSADEFMDIARHVNSRLRGYEPRERQGTREQGGALPLLGTPEVSEKQEAFKAGYLEIQDYLNSSDEPDEQKIKAVAMATEALIIWVHPFNDGNGRTSRFLAKFIESGVTDVDQLVAETTNKNARLRMYDERFRVDKANVYRHQDLLLDDDEKAEIAKTEMPVDQGIALSIRQILHDKEVQEQIDSITENYRTRYSKVA